MFLQFLKINGRPLHAFYCRSFCGGSSGLLSDIWSCQSGILTEILSDYLSAILSNMSSSILSGILSGTRFMSQTAGSLLSFGPGVTERISKLAIGFGSWRASLKSWQVRQRAAVQRRLAHKLAMTCWQVSVVCAPPCLPACLRGCACAGWGISRDFHLAGGEKGAKHPVVGHT